ncbi:MAG TPA: triose-phosphate isomerase [Chiayiivirga sp.]|nr:triose-phosphate isomerase [Chiayiivirga sp.]
MRRRIVAGNWKLNGDRAFAHRLVQEIVAAPVPPGVERIVLPPLPYLAELAAAHRDAALAFGAQDLDIHRQGAYTGEVSGAMLREVGAVCVLVGHSERRELHGESSALVAQKFAAARDAGLVPILCIGETLAQREAGETHAVLAAQLAPVLALGAESLEGCIVAYEPVWAIGTGLTATPAQAQEVHARVRGEVARLGDKIASSLPILYGGSVKPANAAELFSQPDIDGGLIGGASLVATDFLAIAAAAAR